MILFWKGLNIVIRGIYGINNLGQSYENISDEF